MSVFGYPLFFLDWMHDSAWGVIMIAFGLGVCGFYLAYIWSYTIAITEMTNRSVGYDFTFSIPSHLAQRVSCTILIKLPTLESSEMYWNAKAGIIYIKVQHEFCFFACAVKHLASEPSRPNRSTYYKTSCSAHSAHHSSPPNHQSSPPSATQSSSRPTPSESS